MIFQQNFCMHNIIAANIMNCDSCNNTISLNYFLRNIFFKSKMSRGDAWLFEFFSIKLFSFLTTSFHFRKIMRLTKILTLLLPYTVCNITIFTWKEYIRGFKKIFNHNVYLVCLFAVDCQVNWEWNLMNYWFWFSRWVH